MMDGWMLSYEHIGKSRKLAEELADDFLGWRIPKFLLSPALNMVRLYESGSSSSSSCRRRRSSRSSESSILDALRFFL